MDRIDFTVTGDEKLLCSGCETRASFTLQRMPGVEHVAANAETIPLAATGLVYPVWAMLAMATSVTAIFFNSLWGRPSLFSSATASVGRAPIATAVRTEH